MNGWYPAVGVYSFIIIIIIIYLLGLYSFLTAFLVMSPEVSSLWRQADSQQLMLLKEITVITPDQGLVLLCPTPPLPFPGQVAEEEKEESVIAAFRWTWFHWQGNWFRSGLGNTPGLLQALFLRKSLAAQLLDG